jgi:hypothetical protein
MNVSSCNHEYLPFDIIPPQLVAQVNSVFYSVRCYFQSNKTFIVISSTSTGNSHVHCAIRNGTCNF